MEKFKDKILNLYIEIIQAVLDIRGIYKDIVKISQGYSYELQIIWYCNCNNVLCLVMNFALSGVW